MCCKYCIILTVYPFTRSNGDDFVLCFPLIKGAILKHFRKLIYFLTLIFLDLYEGLFGTALF